MDLTLKVDHSGLILTDLDLTQLPAMQGNSHPPHLADLFTVSRDYDAALRQQWFAVMLSRKGLPTAITPVGEALPAQLLLTDQADDPAHLSVTIKNLPPIDLDLSSTAPAYRQIGQGLQQSDISIYIRRIDGRLQVILGPEKNRPHTPLPLQAGESVFDRYLPRSLAALQRDDDILARDRLPLQVDQTFAGLTTEQIFRTTKFPLFNDAGDMTIVAGISHDISTEIQAREQTEATRRRITDAIMSSPIAVTISDLETGILEDVNNGFLAKYGYQKSSIIGRTTIDIGLINQEDRRRLRHLVEDKDGVVHGRFTFHHADGSPVPVEATISKILIDGEPRLLTIARDESRALLAEKRFQMVADASFEGIVLHQQGVILEVNETMCGIVARTREELLGRNIFDFLATEDHNSVQHALTTNSFPTLEITLLRPDGSRRIAQLRTRDASEAGQQSRIGVLRDITEERELKTQLQRAQKIEVLGQLTGGIAHDFNNILASILGYSDLLKTQLEINGEDQLLRWANQIVTSGERGRDLIRQMMVFSRGGNPRPVATDPVAVVEEVLTMIKVTLPATVLLYAEFESDGNQVLIDPTQLNQVLLNLCINASHALPPEPLPESPNRIDIKVTETAITHRPCASCHNDILGEFIAISVKDNGCGMSDETMENIFEPFYTTREVGEGSGMGLAVLHGIVHDARGHILLESEQNTGSTFTILLPRLEQVPAPAAAVEAPHQVKSIAVVDDDPNVANVVGDILKQQGYEVDCFNNPQTALNEVLQGDRRWDLLITDQKMPGMTGLELTRSIRQNHIEIPIVIQTGFSTDLSKELTRQLDFVLLAKPVARAQLLDTVSQLLAGTGSMR